MSTSSVTRRCSICETPENILKAADKKMQQCSICRNAFYCGPGCQRQDWPAHKKVCKPVVNFSDVQLVKKDGVFTLQIGKPKEESK